MPSRGVGMPTLLNRMSSRSNAPTAGGDHLRHVGLGRDVGAHRDGPATLVLDESYRLLGPVEVDVGDHDPRSLLGEAQRRRPAHTRSGAGDHGGLVLQLHSCSFACVLGSDQAEVGTGASAGVNR